MRSKTISTKIPLLCSLKTILQTLLVIVNQYIFTILKFPCPIFLTTLNVISTCFVYLILLWRVDKAQETTTDKNSNKIIKLIDNWTVLKQIVPIGLYTATSLVSISVAYMHLQLSFVQSQQLLLPVTLFLTQYYHGSLGFRRSVHPYQVICVISVVVGLLVGYFGFFPALSVLFMGLVTIYHTITTLTTHEFSSFLSETMGFSVIEINSLLWLMVYFWLLLGCFALEIPLFSDYSISTFVSTHAHWFVASSLLSMAVTWCNHWYVVMNENEGVTLLDEQSFAFFSLFALLGNGALFAIGLFCGDDITTYLQLCGYIVAWLGNGGYFAWQLYVLQYQAKHHIKAEDCYV